MNKGTVTKFKNWILENSNLKLLESKSTESIYLTNDSLKIRISDHIQGSDRSNIRFDISIFIPEESKQYIVSIGYKIYIYNTLLEVKNLLISVFRINLGIDITTINKAVNKQKDANKGINSALSQQIANLSKKNNKYKERIAKLEEKASRYNKLTKAHNKKLKECKKLQSKCDSFMNDISEAKDIISELQNNPDARKAIQISDKTYYIDNFPKDIQDLLKESIQYYNQ
jgi:DNA repair exonuclease SbcCD ATPase subunit